MEMIWGWRSLKQASPRMARIENYVIGVETRWVLNALELAAAAAADAPPMSSATR